MIIRGIGLNIFFSLFLLFPFLSARFFPLERKEDGEEEEEEEEGEFGFGLYLERNIIFL